MPKLTKRFVDSLKPNHNGLDLFAGIANYEDSEFV